MTEHQMGKGDWGHLVEWEWKTGLSGWWQFIESGQGDMKEVKE